MLPAQTSPSLTREGWAGPPMVTAPVLAKEEGDPARYHRLRFASDQRRCADEFTFHAGRSLYPIGDNDSHSYLWDTLDNGQELTGCIQYD